MARKTVKARKPKSAVVADRRRKGDALTPVSNELIDEPIEVRAEVIGDGPAANSPSRADESIADPDALAPDLGLVPDQQLSFEPNIAFRGPRELWLRRAREQR